MLAEGVIEDEVRSAFLDIGFAQDVCYRVGLCLADFNLRAHRVVFVGVGQIPPVKIAESKAEGHYPIVIFKNGDT